MKSEIICPKCNSTFTSKKHLKDGVNDFFSFINQISQRRFRPIFSNEKNKSTLDSSNIIVCPRCGFEFHDRGYRLFGILSPSMVEILLIVFIIILFIAFPMYILIRDLMK